MSSRPISFKRGRKLLTRLNNYSLNDRMSVILLFTGAVLSTIALIISIAFSMPLIMHIPHILVMSICIVLPIIFKKRLSVASLTALYFVSFFYFPFIYYTNNGINGSGPFFFIMIIVYFAFYRKGARLLIILIVLIIYYMAIITLGHFFPQLITSYPDTASQYIDMGISLVSVSIVLSLISGITYNEYNKEREKTIKLAHSLEERNAKLQQLAITDQLTDTYNRHFFSISLQREIDINKESKKEFYIMMIDIDNFKDINDLHGHLYGDEVLKLVALKIKENVRQHNLVARYGGDEFLVLTANTDLETCHKIAVRIKDAIENTYYRDETNTTVSIGIVNGNLNGNAEEVLNNADTMMYQAKHNGRNQICFNNN